MTLREFYKALEAHDWYYMMSDDSSVYDRGRADQNRLLAQARLIGLPALELFHDFHLHQFSGPAWGKHKAPKPPMPEEVTP